MIYQDVELIELLLNYGATLYFKLDWNGKWVNFWECLEERCNVLIKGLPEAVKDKLYSSNLTIVPGNFEENLIAEFNAENLWNNLAKLYWNSVALSVPMLVSTLYLRQYKELDSMLVTLVAFIAKKEVIDWAEQNASYISKAYLPSSAFLLSLLFGQDVTSKLSSLFIKFFKSEPDIVEKNLGYAANISMAQDLNERLEYIKQGTFYITSSTKFCGYRETKLELKEESTQFVPYTICQYQSSFEPYARQCDYFFLPGTIASIFSFSEYIYYNYQKPNVLQGSAFFMSISLLWGTIDYNYGCMANNMDKLTVNIGFATGILIAKKALSMGRGAELVSENLNKNFYSKFINVLEGGLSILFGTICSTGALWLLRKSANMQENELTQQSPIVNLIESLEEHIPEQQEAAHLVEL